MFDEVPILWSRTEVLFSRPLSCYLELMGGVGLRESISRFQLSRASRSTFQMVARFTTATASLYAPLFSSILPISLAPPSEHSHFAPQELAERP
jgi:hypothetical protein